MTNTYNEGLEAFVKRLREILSYNPETGVFRWKVRTAYRVKVGDVAGTINKDNGYADISIGGRKYRSHRLAWLYVHGRLPDGEIDHINGKRSDNRMANLRECSRSENGQNKGIRKDNKSGFVGVSWDKVANKWLAQIRVNNKTTKLGRFDTPEVAHQEYLSAKRKLHRFQPSPRLEKPE